MLGGEGTPIPFIPFPAWHDLISSFEVSESSCEEADLEPARGLTASPLCFPSSPSLSPASKRFVCRKKIAKMCGSIARQGM